MSRHEWKCQQCGRIEKTGRDLAQHIKDAHQSRTIVAAEPDDMSKQDRTFAQIPWSNNPPAAIVELTGEEAAFLIEQQDTFLHQGLAVLTFVQAGQGPMPDDQKASVRKLVERMELAKAIKRKTEGKEG